MGRIISSLCSTSMEALSVFLFCFHAFFTYTTAADTIAVNQTITDGQTIVSAQKDFELGFFSLGNSSDIQYLGIWHKRLATSTVVWVANRDTPTTNKSGELTLHPGGVLVLRDSATNRTIWSSKSAGTAGNPVVRLLDSGNLMVTVHENGPENYIWQSFDHPGDTFLPGMKLGRNLERGVVTNFTSWKSVDDPSQGPYMIYMDFNGLPQIFEKNGDVILYRHGSWNGFAYTGIRSFRNLEYVSNGTEIYVKFQLIDESVLDKIMLTPQGDIQRSMWTSRTQGWSLYPTSTLDICDRYALCGAYGTCDINQSPACECLKGFIPRRSDQWDNTSDWSSGCQQEISLNCGVGEGFRKYSFMKLPDTRQSWFDRSMTLGECEMKCRNECNCTAFTTLDINYDTGCLLWYNELIDMRVFPGEGQDIYIRMAARELEKDEKVPRRKINVTIIVIPVIVGLAILLGLCLLIIRKRKLKAQGRSSLIAQKDVLDLPLFSLSTLLLATNNFSINNKLGQGGFGPVYKGSLEDGQVVAVKRLSESSSQGVEEFKNEVIFISKLQHRNLVKILGCCTEGEEKMLVYEYMPNKGLDLFLFQETKRKMLDWSQRFHIINGIARGLLYLHQDSRLRIIHRDLKAANVLLDQDMNPKISDFGLARSFGGNETKTNTKKVVGTYGYMSPEYAGEGIFSVKSDIFSFGVLMLEIVSGKRNRGFFHPAHNHNLLGHAWRLYKEGKTLELAETSLIDSSLTSEVLRSIQLGLLCVQHNPEARPNMSTVVMMLSSESPLLEPKQPGFYVEDSRVGPGNASSMQTENTNNDVTVTLLEPR